MKSFLLSAAIILLSTQVSHCQKVWSLNDCMVYAVDNSYSAQRALRNLNTKRHNYTSAIGRHLPSLSASVNAGSSFGRGIDPATNTYQTTTSFSNGYGANASLPIFNAFALLNNTLSAKISIARAKSEVQKAQDDAALLAMSSYVDVVYAQKMVELTRQRVETFKTDLRRTERMSELGTKNSADVAQFASNLAREELSLITNQNRLNTALLRLKDVMNYPIVDTLVVDDQLVADMIMPGMSSASMIFDNAVAYLPQIDILGKQLKEAKYQLAISKSNYYPSISGSAGISTNYYTMLEGANPKSTAFGQQFRDNLGQSVSVGMSIPIFRGLSIRMSVLNAKIAYEQAQSDYNEQMRALQSEIQQAVMDLNAAQAQVAGAEKALSASQLAHRVAKRKYEQGVLGVIELQTSYNELLGSQIEYISSHLTLEIKSRQVAYFAGEPLIK